MRGTSALARRVRAIEKRVKPDRAKGWPVVAPLELVGDLEQDRQTLTRAEAASGPAVFIEIGDVADEIETRVKALEVRDNEKR